MVDKLGADYAKLFKSVNPEQEIDPMCTTIEDLLARLDELETLISGIKAEQNNMNENYVKGILGFRDNFEDLRIRIDKLEQFFEIVTKNVDDVEKSIDIAEEELNIPNFSLRSLLKPLLAKVNKASSSADGAEDIRSNLRDGEFQAVPIFKSSEFFEGADLDSTEAALNITS